MGQSITGKSEEIAAETRGVRQERGQIIVEYVLLLVIGVAIAMLITTMMVNRSPENPGFLIVKWREIIEVIGTDAADTAEAPAE